jgi:hypothetical protein
VRTGSTVSNTSGRILDTGESLKAETLTGAQMRRPASTPAAIRSRPISRS